MRRRESWTAIRTRNKNNKWKPDVTQKDRITGRKFKIKNKRQRKTCVAIFMTIMLYRRIN